MERAVCEQVGLFETPEASGAEGTPRTDRLCEGLYGIQSRITGLVLMPDLTWTSVDDANESDSGALVVSSYVRARRIAHRYLGAQAVPCV